LIGLDNSGTSFFRFVLASYIMVLFFSFFEQIFIAALPNLIAAQALNGLLMSIAFAFGGLFIKASAIPVGWKWFYYIDPSQCNATCFELDLPMRLSRLLTCHRVFVILVALLACSPEVFHRRDVGSAAVS
jgi:ABC-type multidrug transport system permease subunit